MRAVAGPNGHGIRGRLKWMAAIAALSLLALTLTAGCGSSENASTGSQLDDASSSATVDTATGSSTAPASQTATAVSGAQQVLSGYTADQCLADMTARYGSADTAKQACDEINSNYGVSVPRSELTTSVLPQEEQKHPDWKPVQPGVPAPQPPGNSQPPSSQQPPSGEGWSGNGGIEITVPGSPSGNSP